MVHLCSLCALLFAVVLKEDFEAWKDGLLPALLDKFNPSAAAANDAAPSEAADLPFNLRLGDDVKVRPPATIISLFLFLFFLKAWSQKFSVLHSGGHPWRSAVACRCLDEAFLYCAARQSLGQP